MRDSGHQHCWCELCICWQRLQKRNCRCCGHKRHRHKSLQLCAVPHLQCLKTWKSSCYSSPSVFVSATAAPKAFLRKRPQRCKRLQELLCNIDKRHPQVQPLQLEPCMLHTAAYCTYQELSELMLPMRRGRRNVCFVQRTSTLRLRYRASPL